MIQAICRFCGSMFAIHPYRAGKAKFCSDACRLAGLHDAIRGARNVNWNGGLSESAGYIRRNSYNGPGRHRAEHILVVERALGHMVPVGTIVHHVNGVKSDYRNDNLVALQSEGEHAELHRKMRVRSAGGSPWDDRLCCTCRKAKCASAFYATSRGYSSECKECARTGALIRASRVPVETKRARDRAYYQRKVARCGV